MYLGRQSLDWLTVLLLLVCPLPARGAGPCATCHPSETAAFERSPMGRSVGLPSVYTEGRIDHKLSGSTLTIHPRGSMVEHAVERSGVIARYPAAYSVGAGIVGYSYMIRVGNYLFQSPASYYTQTQRWDLTPGYETDSYLDFTHQITSGCLFCHTGSVNLAAGTENQFEDPPFTAISCDRCHGSPAAHLKNPVAGSILNPAKLEAGRRDSVCEQCHLEGVTRVLNPGRVWWDFQAGHTTENVFVTYLPTKSDGTLRAVSQSELLAQSQCARQSGGRLWCGTCHDPHAAEAAGAESIKAVCLSCHGDLFPAKRHPEAAECVSCHMPRLRPTNVAHSAVTDHRIPKIARQQSLEPSGGEVELKAWREPDAALVERDLGLAYFDLAANTHSSSALRQAYQILSNLPAEQRRDAPVEADLASAFLQQGQFALATEMFGRAAGQQPSNARYAYCLGATMARAGKIEAAIKELRRSMELDPSQPDAYLELAQIYRKTGGEAAGRRVIQEYLHFMPQNIRMRSVE